MTTTPDVGRPTETTEAQPPGPIRAVAAAPAGAKAPPKLAGLLPRGTRRAPLPTRDWALFTMIVLYPAGRLLGLTLVFIPLLAVPMALELYRRGRVRTPAGFGLWLLLVLFGLAGVTMLGATVPGAIPPDMGVGRLLAFGQRLADMTAAGIVLLYVGNLTERELPVRRVLNMLAALFVVVVAGGLAGMVLPRIQVATPVAHVLPHFLASNGFVKHSVVVEFAQWQAIIGNHVEPRPAAPFQYTNTWGQCLALLAPWFVVATLRRPRDLWGRIWPVAVLAIAMVPTVYSLNRGTWVALCLVVLYVSVRLALRGSVLPVAGVLAATGVLGVVLLATPLGGVIVDRFNSPHSDSGRETINAAAFEAAKSSPIIGYGGQSSVIGSDRSIAIGPTADCSQCGGRDIGSDGQLWLLLITQGFVGAGLYIGFFLRSGWRYRRDGSWIGLAGGATVLLAMWFMTVYNALGMPLIIMMVGLGLLWRNQIAGEQT